MTETIHVYTEADSKASLLAEVHRLQSNLAAMRQARDLHGANSAYLMQERDRLQEQVHVLRVALEETLHEYCDWICERQPNKHTDECVKARAALTETGRKHVSRQSGRLRDAQGCK